MTAPFPGETDAGGISATRTAQAIFHHYRFMARLSDQITTEADLDMKKIAELAFLHCREFDRLVVAPVSDDLAAAVVFRFMASGIEWPDMPTLKADFVALKTEAASLNAWVEANVSGSIDISTISIGNTGEKLETPIIMSPKPTAVNTRVQALRDLFT